MKKILISALMGVSLVAGAGSAVSTVTIAPNGFSNLLSVNNGFAKVTQVVVASATGTNTLVYLYDTPTNATTFTTPVYTNGISYVTNIVYSTTNYVGAVTTFTNLQLVDVQVGYPAATNSYQAKLAGSALAGTATTYNGNYYFQNGIWATNASTGTATVIVTYQQ